MAVINQESGPGLRFISGVTVGKGEAVQLGEASDQARTGPGSPAMARAAPLMPSSHIPAANQLVRERQPPAPCHVGLSSISRMQGLRQKLLVIAAAGNG